MGSFSWDSDDDDKPKLINNKCSFCKKRTITFIKLVHMGKEKVCCVSCLRHSEKLIV